MSQSSNNSVYVGRIVSVALNPDGRGVGMYRVSSRSFPNRSARVLGEDRAAILPKAGFEEDIHKNPYIAYTCIQTVDEYAVLSNGAHTDYIALKLGDGHPPRDALAEILTTMDYERDDYSTPRIAAVVHSRSTDAWLGIVTATSVHVQQLSLSPGVAYYVATYEHIVPGHYRDDAFAAADAAHGCSYIIGQGVFADLEKPVTAAAVMAEAAGGFSIAAADAAS